MERVLVLGCNGMLGSQLYKTLSEKGSNVFGYHRAGIKNKGRDSTANLPSDADQAALIDALITETKPDTVLNCIGVIKQKPESRDPDYCIRVNSLLPHLIASKCSQHGARFIHFSTDCVFSGIKGNYSELDNPDPIDLYGRSKLLGEPTEKDAITIRTSIIGHEKSGKKSLLEWILSRKGHNVSGYSKAVFSGLTTLELSNIVYNLITGNYTVPPGLYHVSSDAINKYELIKMIIEEYSLEIGLEECEYLKIDRSLDSKRFQSLTGYRPKSWSRLIREMKLDYLHT